MFSAFYSCKGTAGRFKSSLGPHTPPRPHVGLPPCCVGGPAAPHWVGRDHCSSAALTTFHWGAAHPVSIPRIPLARTSPPQSPSSGKTHFGFRLPSQNSVGNVFFFSYPLQIYFVSSSRSLCCPRREQCKAARHQPARWNSSAQRAIDCKDLST